MSEISNKLAISIDIGGTRTKIDLVDTGLLETGYRRMNGATAVGATAGWHIAPSYCGPSTTPTL